MAAAGPRGENAELRNELHSTSNTRKKDALKRTIAAMTVGKDVSSLFPDVVQCIQTPQLELKKLVYLYLINYAQSNPDLAILAINTLVKDATDHNALLRSLAIRTMACIPVDKVAEYLCLPLRAAIDDPEPYVRKTAAMAIAKLFDVNPELVRQEGFIDQLADKLLNDQNAIVTSNAVAALADIIAKDPTARDALIHRSSMPVLLAALDKCNEWGQVFILDTISSPAFLAENQKQALEIIDRISPRLQHANPAVVLSSIRLIANNIGLLSTAAQSADALKTIYKRIAAPLVTFMSAEPETQYVALRCANLLIRVHPMLISHEVKVFFCKYNDPLYVKLEKLLLIVRLTERHNLNQVLPELKDYAVDIDPLFVRKSISAISCIAVKSGPNAEHCVQALEELLKSKTTQVVEQTVLAMRVILRKFPDRFNNVALVIAALDYADFDDPDAKTALIWILGEFPALIQDATARCQTVLQGIAEEPLQAQLQTLTTAVKIFLVCGQGSQTLVRDALKFASEQTSSPLLRDRGIYFSRLLQHDPAVVSKIVLTAKPVVTDNSQDMELSLLQELIVELGLISSIFHTPRSTLVASTIPDVSVTNAAGVSATALQTGDLLDLSELSGSGTLPQQPARTSALAIKSQAQQSGGSLLDDIFGPSSGPLALPESTSKPPQPSTQPALAQGLGLGIEDLLGLPAAPGPSDLKTGPERSSAVVAGDLGLDDLLGPPLQASGPTAASLGSQLVPASVPPLAMAETTQNGIQRSVVVPTEHGKALSIRASFSRQNGQVVLLLNFVNNSSTGIMDFAIQLNSNAFGLTAAEPLRVATPLNPGESVEASVSLQLGGSVDTQKGCSIQIAIKCPPLDVVYFAEAIGDLRLVLELDGKLEKNLFLQRWAAIPDSQETLSQLTTGNLRDVQVVVSKLADSRVFLVAKTSRGGNKLYLSAIICGCRAAFLCELTLPSGQQDATLAIRGDANLPEGSIPLMQKNIRSAFM